MRNMMDRINAALLALRLKHQQGASQISKDSGSSLTAGDSVERSSQELPLKLIPSKIAPPKEVDIKKLNVVALWKAALNGDAKALRLLLTHPDINVNATDKSGDTPLLAAVHDGRIKEVKALLGHPKIHVNTANANSPGLSPLHIAVYKGDIELLRLLLTHPGINVNATDKYGQASLHIAVDMVWIEAAKALLDHPNINVNLEIKGGALDGCTALSLAIRNGNGYNDIANLLRSHGAIE